MNLRNVGEYNIGLDIGTGSVGWAVIDSDGEICHFKGKPTWGSRLFPSALPASEARVHRGQRRRYTRRKWRLFLLQELFAGAIEANDPEFFIRLNQSHLLPEDRQSDHKDYLFTLFNDSSFDEKAYFKKFPTIYHLRKWLMETDEKADPRLIYLAFHNIVKHRGNFLQQDNTGLNSQNANVRESVEELCAQLQEYCDSLDIPCTVEDNVDKIVQVLSDTHSVRSHLQEEVQKLLGIGVCDLLDKTSAKKMAKALSGALVGLSAELADVFFLVIEKPEDAKTKIYLSKDEDVESFEEICPDEALPLFEAMNKVYSSFVLQEILSSCPGKTLSVNKVKDYEQYGEDLKLLKALVKEYAPEKYDDFFRGEFYRPSSLHPQKYVYNKSVAKGYTRYNEVRGVAYEDFKKDVEKLFRDTPAVEDARYLDMMERFKEEKFLRRLKTSDNGAIPFQLHLEEMDKIIQNQARFYPFLEEKKKELDSLVTFRIPYYVGPLTQKNARKDRKGSNRFSWSERIEGKEHEVIKPWNWEEIIDKDRSATEFILRMTGTCTYLQGEPVLPRCSLLYEEYCVLNELNGAHFTQDGDKEHRFDYQDRSDMLKELFRKGKVSYKKAADWMVQRGNSNVRVSGGQGEKGFESKLGSYIFFAKDVFGVDEIPESDYPMIEEIILWNTIFEDRDILKEKLKRNYGDCLSDEQIKKIVRKRFTGWGRLSKKLLCGIKVETDNGRMSIMDVLREGNPNNNGLSKAMVFMEIIRDTGLGFDKRIDELNKEAMIGSTGLAIEDLPGSPALRRGVNQALGIVEEIVHIAGHAPNNIFIEVTREEDGRKKGQRTKKRYESLKEAMSKLKKESPEFWDAATSSQLAEKAKESAALDEKLTLYFLQGGKSLYSGKPLEIGRLSEYQVDHIIPQSYIKDDSFENKALVLASENQNKSDQMLLPVEMRRKMRPYWDALLSAGLIGKKKHTNLLRDHIGEKQMKGFIARQLVETSQILKIVQSFLEEQYPETNTLPVKAGLSHELRERIGLVKCREVNDFHHAHDALLAAEIGRFIQKRHPGMYTNPIGYTQVMKQFVKNESDAVRRGHEPGTSPFVIASFMTSGFDEETGELFKDDWSASYEIAKLKSYFNYRQCFISRMPEETSGAFWDQTIYSPRGGKKTPSIPLKKGLSTEKHGGYSGQNPAYFVLIAAYDSKGKPKRLFEGVPIAVAELIKSKKQSIEEWAKQLVESRGFVFGQVLRARLLKYARIDHNGNEYYVPALDCVYSSRELILNENQTTIAAAVCDLARVSDEALVPSEVLELFDALTEKCLILCTRFKPVYEKLVEGRERFVALSMQDKRKQIVGILKFFNCVTARVDLSLIGGSPHAGGITNGFLQKPNDSFDIVDQSITGMFERRTHVGL